MNILFLYSWKTNTLCFISSSLTAFPSVLTSTNVSSAPVCGSPVVSSRIVGGTDAVDGEWPWQVAVKFWGSFICGGSLINEQWVLSAAHCFDYPSSPDYYSISLGMYQLNGLNPHGVTVDVVEIIKRPEYNNTGDRGDIALVKLVTPLNFTNYIQPICLPATSVSFPSGMECWVTGWGTRSSGGSLPYYNTLQKVMTPLIDHVQCDQMYRDSLSIISNITIIQEEKICSGYEEGGKDSCQGDSGGPLMCKVNGTWIQAGIVSWGIGCALPGYPGVYTLAPAYASWIKTYISEMTYTNESIPTPQSTGKGCHQKFWGPLLNHWSGPPSGSCPFQ
uniref:Peptidase S1 domain-containing protein n=1 Tax=Leptobrachium leishanense TaxID=445787 RepID=A0A8C5Q396_9ANUR